MRRPSGMTIATALAVAAIVYLLVIPLATEVISSFRGPYLPFGVPITLQPGSSWVELAPVGIPVTPAAAPPGRAVTATTKAS